MSSEDSSKKKSGGKKSASLSMTQTSSKRQKTNNKETPEVKTVELDMSADVVPLKTTELNHEFMAEIENLQDTQLTECVPKTLKLLNEFHQTKSKELGVCTTKLNEMLLIALFTEAQVTSSVRILSGHPWGVLNPRLKLFTLLKLKDYDWGAALH